MLHTAHDGKIIGYATAVLCKYIQNKVAYMTKGTTYFPSPTGLIKCSPYIRLDVPSYLEAIKV